MFEPNDITCVYNREGLPNAPTTNNDIPYPFVFGRRLIFAGIIYAPIDPGNGDNS